MFFQAGGREEKGDEELIAAAPSLRQTSNTSRKSGPSCSHPLLLPLPDGIVCNISFLGPRVKKGSLGRCEGQADQERELGTKEKRITSCGREVVGPDLRASV